MKFLYRIFAFLAVLLVLSGLGIYTFGTSDLRTEIAKTAPEPDRAAQLMKQMFEAHGAHYWDSVETYRLIFEDEFYGFIGINSHPYAEDKVRLKLSYIPKTYDGSLEFISGRQRGETWGIQSWKTYSNKPGKDPEFARNADIYFWVPTYQYFVEFPMRIQQAKALAYAGEKTIDGVPCEGLIASWNTTAPQRDIDQYLIWISSTDHLIQKLEYTIREQYNFLTGAAYFKEYKNYNGLLLPSRMPVESNLVKEGFLHEMRILDFIENPLIAAQLRPDTSLAIVGDAK